MTTTAPPATRVRGPVVGLAVASHPGPAAAVTVVAALLAVDAGLPGRTVVVVALAVLAGQLTVGWANDLLDARRDRTVARADKPLATGEVTAGTVAAALGVAAVACVGLSLAAGWRSAVAHLLVALVAAHAYNAGLKRTWFSWVPFAVAFGALPAVAFLAGAHPVWPPWWMTAAGAALGVGAHVVNALPDLADDLRTGVRGLPHRLGERGSRGLAAGLLVGASVLAAGGPLVTGQVDPPGGARAVLLVVGVVLVVGLGVVTLTGRARWPFRAAMGIALLDVVLIVAAG